MKRLWIIGLLAAGVSPLGTAFPYYTGDEPGLYRPVSHCIDLKTK